MGVSVGFKCSATGGANEAVDCLAVHGFRVRLPPSHTASVGAESFVLCPWRVLEGTSTVNTGVSSCGLFLFYRNADIVSTAIRLDGVFRYAEIIGNSGAALTFAT